MTHEAGSYSPTRRERLSDALAYLVGRFWASFWDDLTLRRLDRFAQRSLTFVLTVITIYVCGLAVYELAVCIAVAYGVWPQW